MFIDYLITPFVIHLFPRHTGGNVMRHWPVVKKALKDRGLGDSENLVIYALATIRVETDPVFTPNAERPNRYSILKYPDGYVRPFGQYDASVKVSPTKSVVEKDGRTRTVPARVIINHGLGNHFYARDANLRRAMHGDAPIDDNDGENYRGRGFVQITGRDNYTAIQKKYGDKLGINIVLNPDKASDPEIAAIILAEYIAARRTTIEQAMRLRHYQIARCAVNKAALGLKEFTEVIELFHRFWKPIYNVDVPRSDSLIQRPVVA